MKENIENNDKSIVGEVTLEKISATSLKMHNGFVEKYLPQE